MMCYTALVFCAVVSWTLTSVRAVALIPTSRTNIDKETCYCAITFGIRGSLEPELQLEDAEQVDGGGSGRSCAEACQMWGNKWVTKSKAQLCGNAQQSPAQMRQKEVGVVYKDQTMTEFVLGNVIQVPLTSCIQERKLNTRQIWNGTVDAQSAVDSENQTIVVGEGGEEEGVDEEETVPAKKEPILFYVKHLRELMLAVGFYEPYVKSLFSMVDRVDIGDLADRFKVRFLFNMFKTAKTRFKYEMDAGLCFVKFMTHSFVGRRHQKILNVFNDLTKAVIVDEGRSDRSLNLTPSIKGFIRKSSQNPQTQHLMEKFFNVIFSAIASNSFPNASISTEEQLHDHKSSPSRFSPEKPIRAKPEWQKVGLDVVRFYLRRHFAALPGNNVRREDVAEEKAARDLAQAIEGLAKPFIISVLGVVPGALASEHFINTRTSLPPLADKVAKVPKLPQERPGGSLFSPPFQTGNQFFDIGNSVFGNLHGATDNTHGLFCLKQYAVNKIWFKFQAFTKSFLRF